MTPEDIHAIRYAKVGDIFLSFTTTYDPKGTAVSESKVIRVSPTTITLGNGAVISKDTLNQIGVSKSSKSRARYFPATPRNLRRAELAKKNGECQASHT